MNIEHVRQRILSSDSLSATLGIQFLSTPEPDEWVALMNADQRLCQPFGFLSGGALAALAETLAGVASLSLCPDAAPVGISVAASHLRPVSRGTSVRAVARIIHRGRSHHSFLVSIFDQHDTCVSSIQVTKCIIPNPAHKDA